MNTADWINLLQHFCSSITFFLISKKMFNFHQFIIYELDVSSFLVRFSDNYISPILWLHHSFLCACSLKGKPMWTRIQAATSKYAILQPAFMIQPTVHSFSYLSMSLMCSHSHHQQNVFLHFHKRQLCCLLGIFSLAKSVPSKRFLHLWKEIEVTNKSSCSENKVGVQ